MKVVTILIPSLHGLGVRQKCLGVYSLLFASVTRKTKKAENKKRLHFQNVARLQQAYQFISFLTSICCFPTAVLSPTFQYARPQHENYQERGRMQSSRSSHFSSNSICKNSTVLITSCNISIRCFKKVQYFYSFFIQHMFFPNSNHNIFQQNEHLRYKNYYIIIITTWVLTSSLPITQRIFLPLLNRVMPFFFSNLRTKILISFSECKQGLAEVDLVLIQS